MSAARFEDILLPKPRNRAAPFGFWQNGAEKDEKASSHS
jgi:hypothetical protein